ncbi:MAG: shikimate dehydrogenase [Desulfuromonas sp.]|nr:MAG: shikimate dehydrogenase [Desulfuromonas sp.]
MKISGRTKVVGIFGDPVGHSLSPKMQNAALQACGIDAVYVAFHVGPQSLAAAVEAIRTLGMIGANVTVPHKENVIPYLDRLDPRAERIGAVNTIVHRQGELIGYNTDGVGLIRALQSQFKFNPAAKKVVLLGAGGAARAALCALADAGAAKIILLNRTVEKAEDLVANFARTFPSVEIEAHSLVEEEVLPAVGQADLLINTTTVGLHGEDFDLELIGHLPESGLFFDMVYTAMVSPLQQSAARRGIPFADGRGMLVGQGEAAFALWFDQPAPVGIMEKNVAK